MKVTVLPLVFLLCSGVGLRAQAAPVGFVAQVSGQVVAVQGPQKSPLRLLGRVESGTTVSCGPASQAVIVLFNGGSRYHIGANSRAQVQSKGVVGAKRLAELSGPSASAVKLLSGARVGAKMSRLSSSYQRLLPTASGFVEGPTPRFEWQASRGKNAARYTFTLFDGQDNVVWSTSTAETSVTYPETLPALLEKRPYLWKLSVFNEANKSIDSESRWGIVTLLSSEDARSLEATVAELQAQAKESDSTTPLLLLAETYRSYGVLNSALEVLDDLHLRNVSGANDAKTDMLDSLSPFGRTLAGRVEK